MRLRHRGAAGAAGPAGTLPGVKRAALAGIAAAAWTVGLAVPAHAAIEGPCAAEFNGIAVERIDSISSPLELTIDDELILTGVDSNGTTTVRVSIVLGMLTIDRASTAYGPDETDFEARIDLGDLSAYGVGLLRVHGATDDCAIDAWIRVSGRMPLATLTGIVAAGLAIGGLTAQLGSVASRRRWSQAGAATGGLATGAGVVILGQQLGRLQLSLWSIAIAVAIAAGLGVAFAWVTQRDRRPGSDSAQTAVVRTTPGAIDVTGDQRMASAEPTRVMEPGLGAGRATAADPELIGAPLTEETPEPGADPAITAEEQVIESSPNGGPYWCYVMASTEVLHLEDHTTVVGTLQPSTWYLAKREAGGWVLVVTDDDAEGWVAATAVHRQG